LRCRIHREFYNLNSASSQRLETAFEIVTSVAKQQNLGIEQLIWLQRITSEYCGSSAVTDEHPETTAKEAADAPRLSPPPPDEPEEAEAAAKSPTEGPRRLINRGMSRVDV